MLEIMFKFPNKKTPKNVLLRRMSSWKKANQRLKKI
jgi:hypothetical protein